MTVIGQNEIEILENLIHMYNSYGLSIIGIPTHEMGRVHDYGCIKHRLTSLFILSFYTSTVLVSICL